MKRLCGAHDILHSTLCVSWHRKRACWQHNGIPWKVNISLMWQICQNWALFYKLFLVIIMVRMRFFFQFCIPGIFLPHCAEVWQPSVLLCNCKCYSIKPSFLWAPPSGIKHMFLLRNMLYKVCYWLVAWPVTIPLMRINRCTFVIGTHFLISTCELHVTNLGY